MNKTIPFDARQAWKELRLTENAMRFYGDLFLGAVQQVEDGGKQVVVTVPNAPAVVDPGGPPCYPPWPCAFTVEEVRQSLEATREYMNWLVQSADALLTELAQHGITRVVFRPTQLPAYPYGSQGRPEAAPKSEPSRSEEA
jgi:hypothetical protein